LFGAPVAQKTQGTCSLSGDYAFFAIVLPPVNWDARIARWHRFGSQMTTARCLFYTGHKNYLFSYKTW
jgi:hypothetical protein